MPSTSPETERALARYTSPPNTPASSTTSSDNYALLVERARSWHLTKLQSPPLRTPHHRIEGMDADVGYDADSESEEWEESDIEEYDADSESEEWESDIEEYDADSAEVGCGGAVFVRGDTGSGEDGEEAGHGETSSLATPPPIVDYEEEELLDLSSSECEHEYRWGRNERGRVGVFWRERVVERRA